MHRLARTLAIVSLCAIPALAHSTGGVWCELDDKNVGFRFKAVSSRDGVGGWFDIDGHVETKFGQLPKNLKRFQVRNENVVERWWGPEGVLLNVQKYDSNPFAAVRLTVVTKTVDEGGYEGTYELRITAGSGDEAYVTRTGKISCQSD